jgi:beta-lactamase class A
MAGNVRRFLLGEVLSQASREHLTGWMVNCKTGANRLRAGLPANWRIGDKTGNNGKDAAGDIAVAWPRSGEVSGGPVVICAYTQGGSPTPDQFTSVFTEIGRMVGEKLG